MHKKRPLILTATAFFLIGLTSCLKQVSNNNNNNPAHVAFVNMVPAGPAFKVSLDNNLVGSDSTFPYASFIPDPATGALSYISLYAGIHAVAFTDSASGNILVSGQTQFSNNIKYSIYLFDTLTPQGLQAVQLQDSWDSIPRGYALMRFLNFSPNSPPIDIWVTGDTLVFLPRQYYAGSSNVSAGSLSNYHTLTPGTYHFQFLVSGTNDMVLDSMTVPINAGKAYSIFVTGLLDSTANKAFTHGVINMN